MKTLPDEKIREINVAVSRWLKGQGISHAEAAQRMGVGIDSVNNQLSTRHFTPKMAKRWHDAFGLSERFLLSGSGPITDRMSGYQKIIEENDQIRSLLHAQRDLIERQKSELELYRSLYGPIKSPAVAV